MATRVKIWDLVGKDGDGPVQVEMWSIDAERAKQFDPDRYVDKLPPKTKPGPGQALLEARWAAERGADHKDPHYPKEQSR